ncbi:MAG: PilZ domain-containing protein [Candidatus Omnitrophica bacterium]|nr:PilZ domain-containing protein [Candidatus Omnitrophota bacterium]
MMWWIGALLILLVPAAILGMILHDDARAERARPPMGWVRRLWRGAGKDRRRHPRHLASIPLTYRVLAPNAAPSEAVTRDLSLGGIGMLLSEKLLPGTELELRLQGAPAGPLVVRGAVRWVREMPPQPGEARRLFWAGLELLATTAITQQQLQAILDRLTTSNGRPDA